MFSQVFALLLLVAAVLAMLDYGWSGVTKNMITGTGGLQGGTTQPLPSGSDLARQSVPTATSEGIMRSIYMDYFWDAAVPFGPSTAKVSRNMAASDIAQIFFAPAGLYVLAVMIEEVLAEGSTLTVDIGDTSAATAYINAFNGNQVVNANLEAPIMDSSVAVLNSATGNLASSSTTRIQGIQGGKMYTTDDQIILTFHNTSVKVQLRISLVGFWLRSKALAALVAG